MIVDTNLTEDPVFTTRGRQPQYYYGSKFSWKLRENEENWIEKGGLSIILRCRSATEIIDGMHLRHHGWIVIFSNGVFHIKKT